MRIKAHITMLGTKGLPLSFFLSFSDKASVPCSRTLSLILYLLSLVSSLIRLKHVALYQDACGTGGLRLVFAKDS